MKATELLYIEDFPRVCELIKKHIEECDPGEPFDELAAVLSLQHVVNDIKRIDENAWLVWDGGVIVGYAFAHSSPFIYNNRIEATLQYHYVQPESRIGGMAAFALLHTFQNWAKLIGASHVTLGAQRTDPKLAEKINRMYEKRGFKLVGAVYQQRI